MNPSTDHAQHRRVVLIGASDKPERYAYQAAELLLAEGHEVVPIHPRLQTVLGLPVLPDLSAVTGPVDTVTLYIGPAVSSELADALLNLRPRRVIQNPGAENPALAAKLEAANIECLEACTLVMLRTGQF